jgi:hypothetical protein
VVTGVAAELHVPRTLCIVAAVSPVYVSVSVTVIVNVVRVGSGFAATPEIWTVMLLPALPESAALTTIAGVAVAAGCGAISFLLTAYARSSLAGDAPVIAVHAGSTTIAFELSKLNADNGIEIWWP